MKMDSIPNQETIDTVDPQIDGSDQSPNPIEFQCDICKIKVVSKWDLDRHKLLHNALVDRYICPYPRCKQTCANKTNLRIHYERKHKRVLNPNRRLQTVKEPSKYPYRMDQTFGQVNEDRTDDDGNQHFVVEEQQLQVNEDRTDDDGNQYFVPVEEQRQVNEHHTDDDGNQYFVVEEQQRQENEHHTDDDGNPYLVVEEEQREVEHFNNDDLINEVEIEEADPSHTGDDVYAHNIGLVLHSLESSETATSWDLASSLDSTNESLDENRKSEAVEDKADAKQLVAAQETPMIEENASRPRRSKRRIIKTETEDNDESSRKRRRT
ncbi:uncharacterized protein LOC129580556 [Sitodiplosis mosellana]|uniref:uncharacterized protein LOC129580556 n=1 Tax=Sitodiplosis mosellana TaxID=263140 RepID=UPI002444F44D|nr:uncharacterized protein LOC129580556 [Sitodiplosis mosellana]